RRKDGSIYSTGERNGRTIPIRLGAFLKGNTKSLEKLTVGSIPGIIYQGYRRCFVGSYARLVLSKTAVSEVTGNE
ncbi:MAG TPA: hypothetical protein PKZ70_08590, partial [Candidatus Atribacteria bacterium]|nr:hypothetical protein [Candidatus Atribacteria bacterium]